MKSQYRFSEALFEFLGFTFITYWVTLAASEILLTGNILTGVVLVPGVYGSHAYPIVIWGAFFYYFTYTQKFGWKTVCVFFIANGVNGEVFNWLYNLEHGIPPFSEYLFYVRVALDIGALIVSVGLLWPEYRLKLRFWTGWLPLALLACGYLYVLSIGYPVTIQLQYWYNPVLNLIDFNGLICYPVLFFCSLERR